MADRLVVDLDGLSALGDQLQDICSQLDPEGTMANLGNDSSRISEALQVAPSETGATIAHNYRPEGLVLETHTDVPVASSTVQANTQYGAGGSAQHFIPNVPDQIAAGDITVHGVAGARYVTDFAGYGYQGYRATNQAMEMAR